MEMEGAVSSGPEGDSSGMTGLDRDIIFGRGSEKNFDDANDGDNDD
jgi:hypothetical protein